MKKFQRSKPSKPFSLFLQALKKIVKATQKHARPKFNRFFNKRLNACFAEKNRVAFRATKQRFAFERLLSSLCFRACDSLAILSFKVISNF